MSLATDLGTAVGRVVEQFKNNPSVVVDDKLKAENERLSAENIELSSAIQSAITDLSNVVTTSQSNMAEPITTVNPPVDEHIPS